MGRIPATDPHDHGPGILQVTWVLTTLSIVITLLRVFVRLKTIRTILANDWFMILALLLQIASQACITESYQYGLGMHDKFLIQDPTMPYIDMVKWVYISTVPGVLCSIAARISICLLLISLFGTKIWLKWWLVMTTTLVALVGIASIAVTWSQAKPVEALWNTLIPAKRWNQMVSLYVVFVSGAIFALTDFTYVLFPVIIIWNLRMPLRRKLGLCVLMAGSIFSVATCIMRIITAKRQNLFLTGWGMLWASIEQSLVVLLGSAPILPALRKLDIDLCFLSMGRYIVSVVSPRGTKRQRDGQQDDSESSVDIGNNMVKHSSWDNTTKV